MKTPGWSAAARCLTLLGLILGLGVGASASADGPETAKRAVGAARLVLPFFEIDMANPDGKNAFFSVRNETSQPADIRLSYFAADRPQLPQHTETVTLAGKAIRPVDVSKVPNLLVDTDGFARGWAVVETVSGDPVIQGEYFLLTPGEAFATGNRLLNADPQSEDNDLCSVFTIRFLNGGFFNGGTELIFWLDTDQLPSIESPVFSYAVYNEAGELRFVNDLFAQEVAFRRPADELVSIIPTSFGALEIELHSGLRGHVLAVMSALGKFSVGVEASCSD